jgi:hypothetical protein
MRDAFDAFTPPDRGLFGENEQKPQTTRVNGRSDLHDLTLILRQKKPLSIAVTQTDGAGPWIWLPKSEIEYVEKGKGVVEVTIPEWLAVKKGLV